MQISRHWRLQGQRYRLEGYRLPDGTVSFQDRKTIPTHNNTEVYEENGTTLEGLGSSTIPAYTNNGHGVESR